MNDSQQLKQEWSKLIDLLKRALDRGMHWYRDTLKVAQDSDIEHKVGERTAGFQQTFQDAGRQLAQKEKEFKQKLKDSVQNLTVDSDVQ